MNLVVGVLVLMAVSVGCSLNSSAQTLSKVREKSIGLVEAKYPSSEVTRLELTLKQEEEKQAFYKWKITRNEKTKGVSIYIYFGASIKESAEKMKASNWNIPAGPGSKRTDLGDEAYFFEDTRSEFARIRFRKANVYLDIQANSLAEAEYLAKSIDKFIKKGGR
ncbi:MAG: hypothetical protein IPM25_16660 [Chloracidobacterium sp.]|nr:hypothetical protein [Chloracidobacterium sp.]